MTLLEEARTYLSLLFHRYKRTPWPNDLIEEVEDLIRRIDLAKQAPSEPSPGGADEVLCSTCRDALCHQPIPAVDTICVECGGGRNWHTQHTCPASLYAAPASPSPVTHAEEPYCLCGHAKMAHAGTGCLILGGPKGGCYCREYLPEPAPRGEGEREP